MYVYKLFQVTIKVLDAKQSIYNNISYKKKLKSEEVSIHITIITAGGEDVWIWRLKVGGARWVNS